MENSTTPRVCTIVSVKFKAVSSRLYWCKHRVLCVSCVRGRRSRVTCNCMKFRLSKGKMLSPECLCGTIHARTSGLCVSTHLYMQPSDDEEYRSCDHLYMQPSDEECRSCHHLYKQSTNEEFSVNR